MASKRDQNPGTRKQKGKKSSSCIFQVMLIRSRLLRREFIFFNAYNCMATIELQNIPLFSALVWDRVSLCSPGWYWTHGKPLALAFQVPGSQAWAAMLASSLTGWRTVEGHCSQFEDTVASVCQCQQLNLHRVHDNAVFYYWVLFFFLEMIHKTIITVITGYISTRFLLPCTLV